MAWLYLLIAAGFEVTFAMGMKYAEGFTRLWPSLITVIAAVAGIILTGQASTGVPLGADASLLDSIAAIVVGGTALSGGVGGPHRTLLGALVIVILTSGMDITSVDPYNQLIVKGAVVILAVAAYLLKKRDA